MQFKIPKILSISPRAVNLSLISKGKLAFNILLTKLIAKRLCVNSYQNNYQLSVFNKLLLILLVILLNACTLHPFSTPAKVNDDFDNLENNVEENTSALSYKQLNNGSIYRANYHVNLYSDKSAYQVGDIITIVLAEKTSASKKANTKLQKNFDADIELEQLLQADAKFKRQTQGAATAGQANSLNGAISAQVSKVLPNQTLQIKGRKLLTLNNGDETVTISGVIRINDINPNNQIASHKVANAKISYTGSGAFADSNNPGFLTRLLFSPWSFF